MTNPTGVSAEARMLFTRYIDDEGEDFEACFGSLPETRADPANVSFKDSDDLPGRDAMNRVIIAIDASGSMAGRVGNQTKMEAAKAAAIDYTSSLSDDVEVGLIAFGHRGNNSESGKEKSCSAVETVYAVGGVDKQRVAAALTEFDATGWTPLGSAIESAGRSFKPSNIPGGQVVYVVSDGKETCGGDPISAARKLHRSDVQAVVNIIGFDLAASDREQLKAVATAGGGEFLEVDTPSELKLRLREAAVRNHNNTAMGRSNIKNSTQQSGNTFRTNVALAQLSTCVTGAWSREKQGLGAWLQTRNSNNDINREIRTLIDSRKEQYRERADAYELAARKRQKDAADILEADQKRAREDYERTKQR
ncbi:vWA domain-containing protein [Parasphingorhabdus cellanae]|uniref:VWA domain-containing protein n=1 Tax=Parasphingorhabdus cellanae TaxID=2806553 RepID=A0ABX7T8U6_9SPHN|nr:VWA domain-containing protein [Parasphingorhabdus cellanae]QTD56909.1 VWA domain-containing protein [Parasphingorhabdus cellanae]